MVGQQPFVDLALKAFIVFLPTVCQAITSSCRGGGRAQASPSTPRTRKMVPITGRARSFLLDFKNKIERRGRQNKNNRPINLPKIIHSPQTISTPPNPNLYHTQLIYYLYTYIHTYIFCSSQLLLMIFFLLK